MCQTHGYLNLSNIYLRNADTRIDTRQKYDEFKQRCVRYNSLRLDEDLKNDIIHQTC